MRSPWKEAAFCCASWVEGRRQLVSFPARDPMVTQWPSRVREWGGELPTEAVGPPGARYLRPDRQDIDGPPHRGILARHAERRLEPEEFERRFGRCGVTGGLRAKPSPRGRSVALATGRDRRLDSAGAWLVRRTSSSSGRRARSYACRRGNAVRRASTCIPTSRPLACEAI